MKTIKQWQFILLTCLVLVACIDVNDFGVYWKKGTVDPLLKGSWKDDKNPEECIAYKPNGESYILSMGDEDHVARTLVIGTHHFLMMKKKGEKGGQLIKYSADKNHFTFYQLNKDKKKDFLAHYNTKNIVFGKDDVVVTINVLNPATISMLKDISAQEDYWQVLSVYKHSKCTPQHKAP